MNRLIEPDRKLAVVVAVVLLVGCIVGGVGFVLGRDSAEPAQAQSIVRAAASKRVAEARKAGYQRGYAKGRSDAADRRDAGANTAGSGSAPDHRDALAVDDFNLDPGYYVVRVTGASGAGRASDYAPMTAGVSYELCDAYGVCRRTK